MKDLYTLHIPAGAPLLGSLTLTGSKSESNRALLLQALACAQGGQAFRVGRVRRLASARDTQTLLRLLQTPEAAVWDVLDAGTTMRFLTAYAATQLRNKTLTGTPRMQERPIGILTEALAQLGAEIEYLGKPGYPPIRLNATRPFTQKTQQLSIDGSVSSQFVSALLMVAPTLPLGLSLRLVGHIASRPYLEMTLAQMKAFGVNHKWEGDSIHIQPQTYQEADFAVEADWSGASYWYSLVALRPGSRLQLQGLKPRSLQGDQAISRLMQPLGVNTTPTADGMLLEHTFHPAAAVPQVWDFDRCPDLAQTVLACAAAKGVAMPRIVGLESLRIKETDRIAAMQAELQKLGADLQALDAHTWALVPPTQPLPERLQIHTYDDHRMAMAFAPLAACIAEVLIDDPQVVAKSYPGFWDDLRSLGVEVA
jgi:3-phosphoshikimate 1-carboxyvinyltransferase